MPKVDIRIDKPKLTFTFAELKTGEFFWCTDGYLNIKCKDADRAVVLEDGQIWKPVPTEEVRPERAAIIRI